MSQIPSSSSSQIVLLNKKPPQQPWNRSEHSASPDTNGGTGKIIISESPKEGVVAVTSQSPAPLTNFLSGSAPKPPSPRRFGQQQAEHLASHFARFGRFFWNFHGIFQEIITIFEKTFQEFSSTFRRIFQKLSKILRIFKEYSKEILIIFWKNI